MPIPWDYVAVAAMTACPLLAVIGVLCVAGVRMNRRLSDNFEQTLAAALAVQAHDLVSVRQAVRSLGAFQASPRQPSPEEPVPALHVVRE